MNEALPAYTSADIKRRLLECEASGTIYALVMPESEAGMMNVVDGGDMAQILDNANPSLALLRSRHKGWLTRFHEPWTQKQDSMHVEYFDTWLEWSAPVVSLNPGTFPHRYPTAGASEGIAKLMAEYSTRLWSTGKSPTIHVFEGEYEGFAAFAHSFSIPLRRHSRDDWAALSESIDADGQFWISQPSSIDGGLWPHFQEFVDTLALLRPDVEIIPDLSYVGAVADPYLISLDSPNIPAFVISHSKPFGGYYHRCGGVFARTERGSLFGNRWFKNLTSLAWGVQMMKTHGVFDLPRKYRPHQIRVAEIVAERLGIADLKPASISMLATAPVPESPDRLVAALVRGEGSDRCVRVCLTPAMTMIIAPHMAPSLCGFNNEEPRKCKFPPRPR